ncbi:MAG: biotin--[acetyl-CoA-carboxylase] ligase [Oligoflexia bacterium]|nr:biotin--[acetyl-CoA-carboxylase] ligase [Oligoflexia bacterium]
MKHVHFESCESTQLYLKKEFSSFENDENILISTSSQTQGVGRSDNKWLQTESSLAFSFSLTPNKETTLTSLEIGALLAMFFQKHCSDKIKLKWPNDLMLDPYSKCGGVICHMINPKKIVVGVGINLSGSIKVNERYQAQSLYLDRDEVISKFGDQYSEVVPKDIYQYILDNRLSSIDVINSWNQNCLHLNSEVIIKDGKSELEGIFLGIDELGCALIQDDEKIHKVVSGSLFIS